MNPFLTIILFVCLILHGSDASFFDNIRKLAGHEPKSQEISPSPNIAPGPENFDDKEKCLDPSKTCHDHHKLTACVNYSPNASKKVLLLVKNGGESPLKVNLTISHVKNSFQEMQIPGHRAKEIDISANIGGSPSIVLNAGNEECIISMGSPVSGSNIFNQIPSFATNLTPIHGAYFLFLTALIVGGTWACCKLGKSERQVDGIPYQELEMGQADSLSANIVETAEGWDQGWDDDWEEIKEVKSPNGRQMGNVSANGLTSRSSDRDAQGSDWDD